MIKIENAETPGANWMIAVSRGMRNSFNSWHLNDTNWMVFGPNDMDLAKRLVKTGTSDAKFMRMIPIIFDITAPMYFWKEFDTYKVATVRNSCSTMHKIMAKEFTIDDFSIDPETSGTIDGNGEFMVGINNIIYTLNELRKLYLEEKDPTIKRSYWDVVIQMLPESYNQKSTVTMNYAVLSNIYHQRKNHKLREWHEFCDWIKTLPMSELITGEFDDGNEDPKEKKPIWIPTNRDQYGYADRFKCGKCGFMVVLPNLTTNNTPGYKFCPCCGSKMENSDGPVKEN